MLGARLAVATSLVLAALVAPAHATQQPPRDLDALARDAALIVHVTVLRQSASWSPESPFVFTDSVVLVDEVIGQAPGWTFRADALVVRQLGGVYGEIRQDVAGSGLLAPGDEAILFLVPKDERFAVLDLAQGRILLHRDATGTLRAGDDAEPGRAAPTYTALRARLQAALAAPREDRR